jgi:hypothetical protein
LLQSCNKVETKLLQSCFNVVKKGYNFVIMLQSYYKVVTKLF